VLANSGDGALDNVPEKAVAVASLGSAFPASGELPASLQPSVGTWLLSVPQPAAVATIGAADEAAKLKEDAGLTEECKCMPRGLEDVPGPEASMMDPDETPKAFLFDEPMKLQAVDVETPVVCNVQGEETTCGSPASSCSRNSWALMPSVGTWASGGVYPSLLRNMAERQDAPTGGLKALAPEC